MRRAVRFASLTPSANRARDERGQSTVEYILLLAASAVGCILLAKTVLGTLDKGALTLGGQLEKDLKTGRSPLSVWAN
jgi:hypothetical protein